jgi:hypothetical protein
MTIIILLGIWFVFGILRRLKASIIFLCLWNALPVGDSNGKINDYPFLEIVPIFEGGTG